MAEASSATTMGVYSAPMMECGSWWCEVKSPTSFPTSGALSHRHRMPSRMLCKGCHNGRYRHLPPRRTANRPRGRSAELFTL